MRLTIFTALISAFVLAACGQTTDEKTSLKPEQEENTAKQEESTATENPDVLPEGKVIERYKDGSKKIVVKFAEDDSTRLEERHYHPGGELKIEGYYKEGQKHGNWMSYYDNGNRWSENNYYEGEFHGPYRQWFYNGNLKLEGRYQDGEEVGEWRFFDSKGNLVETKSF